jgi:hypothetical protein
MAKKKKDKRTNNDLLNITQKTKDRATRSPIKTGGELGCPERVSRSCSTSDTRRVTVKQHEHRLIWKLGWTLVCVNNYKIHIYIYKPCQNNKKNRTSCLGGNRSGNHNTELKTTSLEIFKSTFCSYYFFWF